MLNPFVCAEQRHRFCYLRWCEINFVVAKWPYNRTDLRRIPCYLFQFLLLRMEFIGFVFEFLLILGNEFLYIFFLRFIPVKSYFPEAKVLSISLSRFPLPSISRSSFHVIVCNPLTAFSACFALQVSLDKLRF